MHPLAVRREALELITSGLSLNQTSKRLGVNRSTLRVWRDSEPVARSTDCWRCEEASPPDAVGFSYLLGLYLGDGCLSASRKGVYALRIACAVAWPRLMTACCEAVVAVRPGAKVCVVTRDGCHMVTSYWKHWPCLFPQHGPGRKHERRIELEPWQQGIVREHPEPLVRGLIHSDGCRITNWTRRPVAGSWKRYEYPRYFFTNESVDIRHLFTDTLDVLGVAWRQSRHNTISIARRESVARLDRFVGPKS